MTESILTSTKKVLGLAEDYTVFDPDITLFINGVFLSPKASNVQLLNTTQVKFLSDVVQGDVVDAIYGKTA